MQWYEPKPQCFFLNLTRYWSCTHLNKYSSCVNLTDCDRMVKVWIDLETVIYVVLGDAENNPLSFLLQVWECNWNATYLVTYQLIGDITINSRFLTDLIKLNWLNHLLTGCAYDMHPLPNLLFTSVVLGWKHRSQSWVPNATATQMPINHWESMRICTWVTWCLMQSSGSTELQPPSCAPAAFD